MPHYTHLFSNMNICEIRDVDFGEVTAENQGMSQVASHPHTCPSDPQKGKKEQYHTLVLLICFTAHPSFVQPLKIYNWPNFDDLSLPRVRKKPGKMREAYDDQDLPLSAAFLSCLPADTVILNPCRCVFRETQFTSEDLC